ncbi:MAG: rane protein [Marmoricola sp.]|nr:rane protein [Marmoricola sp.]
MTVTSKSVSTRLLNSSARHSYDPDVDVDWDLPFEPDKWFMAPQRMSLFGTPMWESLSEDQRIELSRHEVASIVHMGWWFEVLLMQGLLREIYQSDPRSARTQYALTEIGDETRHSTMFGRVLAKGDLPRYGPPRQLQRVGTLFNLVIRGASLYAGALLVEETQDRWQREIMHDERIQPLTRMVARIHVTEEARHVTFARDELARVMPTMSRAERTWHQAIAAQMAIVSMRCLVHPRVYASVGLDPREAHEVAVNNPHYRASIAWTGEKVMPFLMEQGLVAKPHLGIWQKSFLLPQPPKGKVSTTS